MAGADEADRCDEKVVEVESLVRRVLRLDNDAIKVLQDDSNIWKEKIISLIFTNDSTYRYL